MNPKQINDIMVERNADAVFAFQVSLELRTALVIGKHADGWLNHGAVVSRGVTHLANMDGLKEFLATN